MLLDAWREVKRKYSVDLVIAGRRREDFTAIAPEDGLRLLGETPENTLPPLYSNAIAAVYASDYEGFGLPVLEAMQCGAPVIVSRDPALTEVSGGAALAVSDEVEMACGGGEPAEQSRHSGPSDQRVRSQGRAISPGGRRPV